MEAPAFLLLALFLPSAQVPDAVEAGRKVFQGRCSVCHGADGTGGERGPDITERHSDHTRSEDTIRELIRNGIPESGMPGFQLPDAELNPLVAFVRRLTAPAMDTPVAGDVAAGRDFFFTKGGCASCHMVYGRGGLIGPDLSDIAHERTVPNLELALRAPGRRKKRGYQVVTVRLRDGRRLRGLARNESSFDLQLQTLDGRLFSFLQEQIAGIDREEKSVMPPLLASPEEFHNLMAYLSRLSGLEARTGPPDKTAADRGFSPGDWPTYHGDAGGNRHSALNQIKPDNVSRLAPRWMFPVPSLRWLETTPVVVDGVMYVTAANEVHALDAATGREIWNYQRARTTHMSGDAAADINRGVAVLGDRLFMVTDNAHLIALNRLNGGLLWDVEMADFHQNYGATSAPLIAGGLVISGTSGGDEGVRGFLAAYRPDTGERVWRFWTVPKPGEPLAATWQGRAIEHGCVSTWLTGTYDPKLDLLFWPTGNPCPDFNGDERVGDNLYSDSVLALEPKTGKLRWYFQFTPHDLHDWDATETPMVLDAEIGGKLTPLLVQANRNGFFYVLERATGHFLFARPFVKKLTWASGVDGNGRPMLSPNTEPTRAGTAACPAVEGATNWMSSAYNPATGLFYVMALEKCSIYIKSDAVWQPEKSYFGGTTRGVPGEPGQKFLRAIDVKTGRIVWEVPQIGTAESWGGLLSAGGLVFYCDDSGAFAAADARTGNPLWHFHTNQLWKASPMTYLAGGKQYIAVGAGSDIIAFALP